MPNSHVVRTRFAPSPTGELHIGGARTALYCYLFAKSQKEGKFILRVEDTDHERSTREFEKSQQADLAWLGLSFDEKPALEANKTDVGDYGPYRQSERYELYMALALALVDKGHAYYDFCTPQELEAMKEASEKLGTPAYTGRWREENSFSEARQRVKNGEKAAIRFKVPPKDYSYTDLVRGEITFPKEMVSDFILTRADGSPLYNFCCVVDDVLMGITHVIRGEDHVNNTAKQLMIFEALFEVLPQLTDLTKIGLKFAQKNMVLPQFAHVSLLIGSDRQKLSKRHGATSVAQFKKLGYLPQALLNYLCLLGWSHPEEKDVFTVDEIIPLFDLTRFNRAPAIYDIEKLNYINSRHLRALTFSEQLSHLKDFIPRDHFLLQQASAWQERFLKLMMEKIQLITELPPLVESLILSENFAEVMNEETLGTEAWEIYQMPSTQSLKEFYRLRLQDFKEDFLTSSELESWMNEAKNSLGVKGKPLFMGTRLVLTGQNHGPDLKELVSLTPVAILKMRLKG